MHGERMRDDFVMHVHVHTASALVKFCNYFSASSSFKVRVVGDGESFSSSGRGRVEVEYKGVWGTVCDANWDLNAANVVCKGMGWRRAVRPSLGSEFGRTWGPIWMDFVRCRGDESSLEECGHTGWGLVNCSHGNDAGVVCTSKRSVIEILFYSCLSPPSLSFSPPPSLSLSSDSTESSMSVQTRISNDILKVQYNGEWGGVCYDGWDYSDATVICKELGKNYIVHV